MQSPTTIKICETFGTRPGNKIIPSKSQLPVASRLSFHGVHQMHVHDSSKSRASVQRQQQKCRSSMSNSITRSSNRAATEQQQSSSRAAAEQQSSISRAASAAATAELQPQGRSRAEAEQSRAEQSRAEQSRAEQSRAEQSRAEQQPQQHQSQTIVHDGHQAEVRLVLRVGFRVQ